MSNILLVPVQGGRGAIVLPCDSDGTELTDVLADAPMMLFDALANGTMAHILPPDATVTSGVNIDFACNDGVTIRQTGYTKVLDAATNTDITTTAAGGGSKPTIDLVTNNVPGENSTTVYTSYKAWINVLRTLYTVPSIICVPIGKDPSNVLTTIGFALMIGKLTSEIPLGQDANTAKPLTMTFTATGYSIDSTFATTLKGSTFLPTITPSLGTAINFPQLTQDDLDGIAAGNIVII